MLRKIKFLLFALFVMGLLVSCAAPAPAVAPTSLPPTVVVPTETVAAPTATSLPTAKPPTAIPVPDLPNVKVAIPAGENNESINATVTGTGDIHVIIVNDEYQNLSNWTPLINTLASNEKLSIVKYPYRDLYVTMGKDTIAVYDYLRAQGVDKMIFVCAGVATRPCLIDLSKKPEVIGMVLIASDGFPLKTDFPKLFLTGGDSFDGAAGTTKQAYDNSDEPKAFKTYASGVYASALFVNAEVGTQVIADITDFINGIVSGQLTLIQ